eukprot:scaffold11291_cov72-Cylindrotheca_fusiformis.AAC.1
MTGQRTVPSAWVRGQHIGGSDDVHDGIETGVRLIKLNSQVVIAGSQFIEAIEALLKFFERSVSMGL